MKSACVYTIIHASGAIETRPTEAAFDSDAMADELHAIVGGTIEIVPHFDQYKDKPAIVFCNEEGLLHDLPFNAAATALWIANLARMDGAIRTPLHLVGDIVIVQDAEH